MGGHAERMNCAPHLADVGSSRFMQLWDKLYNMVAPPSPPSPSASPILRAAAPLFSYRSADRLY